MTGTLTETIAAWATEVATRAAQLQPAAARAAFLAECRRELIENARREGMTEENARVLADSCIEGAERIMNELLARGMPMPEGRA
jgi:hypothetical protein